MSHICIYQDYVHNNGVLYKALEALYPKANIRTIDAEDILQGALDRSVFLFVMPGGADLYYCDQLNGKGNALIRAYVENGGTYLGICAGAYYGAKSILWAKGTSQEITGPRELSFCDAIATGPVSSLIEDGDVEKNWDAVTTLSFDGKEFSVLYKGGCVFSEPEDEATVLGSYSDLDGQPPAILHTPIGQGHAILSSPHIEYSPELYARSLVQHLNPAYARQAQIAEHYKKICSEHPKPLLKQVLKKAGIEI